MRPNGQTGWVPRNALGRFHVVRTMLRVNRATQRATLYRDARPIWSSRVGVGKRSTPTPTGHFWIRSGCAASATIPPTGHPLERFNREVGRRTDVVGIFPDDPSLIRLVSMLAIEANDEWLVGRSYISHGSMMTLYESRSDRSLFRI